MDWTSPLELYGESQLCPILLLRAKHKVLTFFNFSFLNAFLKDFMWVFQQGKKRADTCFLFLYERVYYYQDAKKNFSMSTCARTQRHLFTQWPFNTRPSVLYQLFVSILNVSKAYITSNKNCNYRNVNSSNIWLTFLEGKTCIAKRKKRNNYHP